MTDQIKVLLDTNVWISGLLWGGTPRQIINLAEQKKIVIYNSLRLFQELEETLVYPKLQSRIKLLQLNSK